MTGYATDLGPLDLAPLDAAPASTQSTTGTTSTSDASIVADVVQALASIGLTAEVLGQILASLASIPGPTSPQVLAEVFWSATLTSGPGDGGAWPDGSYGKAFGEYFAQTFPAASSGTGFTLDPGDSFVGANLAGWSALLSTGEMFPILSNNTATNALTIGGWAFPYGLPQGTSYSLIPPPAPVKLTSDGLDAVQVEPGINARQALSPILAFAGGTLAGATTGTIVINGASTTTPRMTATTDADGNRTAVTLHLPA